MIPDKEKNVIRSVSFKADNLEWIKEICERTGQTVSFVVNFIIEKEIKSQETTDV